MKKLFSVTIVSVVLFFVLPTAVSAKPRDTDDFLNDFSSLIPEGSEISADGEEMISSVGFDFLVSELMSAVSSGSGEILSFLLLLLGFSLLLGIAELSGGLFEARFSTVTRAGVFSVTALFIASRLIPVFEGVGESLDELTLFFSGLVPIVTGISASSGAVASAGVQALNMNITLSVIGGAVAEILLPLSFAVLAFSLVGSLGDSGFSHISSSLRSVFLWGIGITELVLTASVSLQSFIARASDTASVRALKYAVSGTVPIVGSTVSGALSTLSGALSYTSSLVGVGSVAVILTMAISPLVIMILYRFSLSFAVTLLNFLGAHSSASCIGSFRAALDSLMAVYAMSVTVYILEISVFMKSGVNLFG